MDRKRGFIIKELMLYLFMGSLLLVTSLHLFRLSWTSYQTINRLNQVKNDFINVSERLKIDLYKDIHRIVIGKESFTFSFYIYDNKVPLDWREYTFLMDGGRLVYTVFTGKSATNIYLSDLVKKVSYEAEKDLLTVIFDYGDYQFRRAYRIEHIQTQRILYSLLTDPLSNIGNQCWHFKASNSIGLIGSLPQLPGPELYPGSNRPKNFSKHYQSGSALS